MFVEQILPRARERLAVVEGIASIQDAAALMAQPHTELVIVCSEGVVTGVVTKADVLGHISRCSESGLGAPVETIMKRDVACCRSSDPLLDVWQVLKARGFQGVPVVDEANKPLGTVYARDVLQCLLQEVEIDDQLLRDFISGVGYH